MGVSEMSHFVLRWTMRERVEGQLDLNGEISASIPVDIVARHFKTFRMQDGGDAQYEFNSLRNHPDCLDVELIYRR